MPKKEKHTCPLCGGAWLDLDFTACRDGKSDIYVLCKGCGERSPALHVPDFVLGAMLARPTDSAYRLVHDWKESLEKKPEAQS